MPTGIPLQQIPNQSFTITLAGTLFNITLKRCNGVMVMSASIEGVDTIDNLICAAGAPIIPARYLETGNLMFLTANNQLPDYRQFGLTQSLLYFTAAELAVFRVPPVASSPAVPTVTAAFFNPIAGLPLRFAPQGYTQAS